VRPGRLDAHATPDLGSPPAHRLEAHAVGTRFLDSASIILDGDAEVAVRPRQPHTAGPGAGVAGDVRERLGDDAESSLLDGGGQ
jgi:hypothetical protein